MKTLKIIGILALIMAAGPVEAQFIKKIGKAVERSAKRTVERRAERETEKKTDGVLDSVFDKKKNRKEKRKKRKDGVIIPMPNEAGQANTSGFEVTRASDFEPGNRILFQDNFQAESQGDFPAKWDTNGSGEIALINGKHWFKLSGNSIYYPMIEQELPEDYTIEFDLFTQGLNEARTCLARISMLLEDQKGFGKAMDWSRVDLSTCQADPGSPGKVEKRVGDKRQLINDIGKDYRDAINGKSHVSIAVNKTRIRLWLNAEKIVDVPRLVPEKANHFKIKTERLRDGNGEDDIYIANFTIAAAGEDNRSKLITEGRLSTNAILFESASATLKGESYTEISKIATVLKENPEVHVQIVGHTDNDGEESSNLALSRKRADAVKQALITAYQIDEKRIQTDGKGETDPVASNASKEGKAQNRRVEFIKL